ncbi:MAG: ATP-grasp domain-containing protein [Eubacteriales bacterium]
MLNIDEKDPPPSVGFTFNLKRSKSEEEAEFDSIETIEAIKKSLESNGYKVVLLEVDKSLPEKLLSNHLDIIFNIAEGANGRSREAQVPALLDFFNLKFTGSDATTLCICLDKALCKNVVIPHGVKTPAFQVIESADFVLDKNIKFPVIVKPNAEGSSKGISSVSVVKSKKQLKDLVGYLLSNASQTLLLEEYIKGREFTVGVLGNGSDAYALRPMEIEFLNAAENTVYDYSVKQDYQSKVKYVCPANISDKTEKVMMETAVKIYNILGCKDLSRIDFMLNEKNELYFIEINPLPGLAPGYSDMPMIAEKNGISYESLINMVLSAAIKRYSEKEAK